jgi:FAD:protein FMN transferase
MKKIYCILLVVLLFFPLSCGPKERMFRKSVQAMDTVVAITVVATSEELAGKAIDAAVGEIRRIENLADFFSEKSEVSLVNRLAGQTGAVVSADLISMITASVDVSERTEGAFDITIGPLSLLNNFRNRKFASVQEIRSALPLIGFRNIVIDRENSVVLLKKKGMRIDLGGIAKGYACDKAVEILKMSGINSGIVAVAGDIRAFGTRPGGDAWRVGIRDPRAEGKETLLGVVELRDEAISTSGDYERFFENEDRRYHHILSPKSGLPATGCKSVTVIGKESTAADPLATAVFVLGSARGVKLIESLGMQGIIVDDAGKIHITEGFDGRLRQRHI